jgi:hypothetical protein
MYFILIEFSHLFVQRDLPARLTNVSHIEVTNRPPYPDGNFYAVLMKQGLRTVASWGPMLDNICRERGYLKVEQLALTNDYTDVPGVEEGNLPSPELSAAWNAFVAVLKKEEAARTAAAVSVSGSGSNRTTQILDVKQRASKQELYDFFESIKDMDMSKYNCPSSDRSNLDNRCMEYLMCRSGFYTKDLPIFPSLYYLIQLRVICSLG